MRRRFKSIKNRIIFFFMGITIFQIVVMAIVTEVYLRPSMMELYSNHLERFTESALLQAVTEKNKMETYMVNIIGDPEIQNFLEQANQTDGKTKPVFKTELRNKILSYTDYDNIIQGIYLLDNQGRIYSNLGEGKMSDFLKSNPENTIRKDASAVWYGSDKDNQLTVYRIINNNTTDLTRKIGVVCMMIDKKEFMGRMEQFLMDENSSYRLYATKDELNLTQGEPEAENKIAVSCTEKMEGWVLTAEIEKAVAYKSVYTILKVIMAELVCLLLISIVLIVYLSGRITKPISDMKKAMKQIGEGGKRVKVPISGDDEIGQLGKTLNAMSSEIEELLEKVIRDEKERNYLELETMQYQINPHFLYNALDSIAMFARKNNDRQCAELAIALSDFFRISLSQGMEIIRLKDELAQVSAYLEIQSIRFPGQLSWNIELPSGLENVRVMKCIVQPAVENSVYHGLRDAGRKGRIIIRCKKQEEDLIIEVQDNGIGMLPNQLDALREKLQADSEKQEERQQGGYGLWNVHQRLRLMYGSKSGITVNSEWEEGTFVTLCLEGVLKEKEDTHEKSKISSGQEYCD